MSAAEKHKSGMAPAAADKPLQAFFLNLYIIKSFIQLVTLNFECLTFLARVVILINYTRNNLGTLSFIQYTKLEVFKLSILSFVYKLSAYLS